MANGNDTFSGFHLLGKVMFYGLEVEILVVCMPANVLAIFRGSRRMCQQRLAPSGVLVLDCIPSLYSDVICGTLSKVRIDVLFFVLMDLRFRLCNGNLSLVSM